MYGENRFLFGCFLVSHVLDIFVSKNEATQLVGVFFEFFERKLWIWINGLNSIKRPHSSITVPWYLNFARMTVI